MSGDGCANNDGRGEWILVDTQRALDYRVLCTGRQLRAATSWRSIRSPVARRELEALLPAAVASSKRLETRTHPIRGQRWRVIADPVLGPRGDVHAALGWVGPDETPVPKEPLVGAWLWDIAGRHTEWSPQLCQLYAVPPDKIQPTYTPEEFFARIDLADHDRLRRLWSQVVQNPTDDVRIEVFHVRRDDGVSRLFRLSGRVLEHAGRPAFLRGISHDVTDLVPADKSATEGDTAGIVRALAALNPDLAVAVMDSDYRQFIHWVSELPAAIQRPPDGLLVPATHPDDLDAVDTFFDVLAEGRPAGVNLRIRGATEPWVSARIEAAPVGTWPDGSARIVATVRRAAASTDPIGTTG